MSKKILMMALAMVSGLVFVSGVFAQGVPYPEHLVTSWGALREWGTVTDYQTGDLGRNAYLTVHVWQGGKLTFQVPKSALINGVISNGSMVGVTYKVVGDKNDHIFVATNINAPRNFRISGKMFPWTPYTEMQAALPVRGMPIASSAQVIPSQCSVC